MADEESKRSPPSSDFSTEFAERLNNAPTDERVYRVALELYEPTRVSEIATRAECAKNTARRHLKRLVDIGVLTQVLENPDTFERNESYFEWRRLNRLTEMSEQEYKQRLGELLTENEAYQDQYDVEKPANLDPLEYTEYGDAEAVWLDMNNWEAIRQEIRDLRRVQQDDAVDEGVV